MALITDPDDLNQGTSTAVSDADWGAPTGNQVTVTSVATELPAASSGDFIEVRDHSVAANNGLYVVSGSPTSGSIDLEKLSGTLPPSNEAAEAVTMLGATGGLKNVMFDTEGLTIWLLEKGSLSTDGATMLAIHSFAKEEWKSDDFLIAAAPFPIVGISFAAGQWQLGVDPSGNYNGWTWADDITSPTTVKTRRLVRNAGWDEFDSSGNVKQKYFNVTTLGTFEDGATDTAWYRFGTDATDTAAAVDYEFAGEVNEPVRYFNEVTGPDAVTGFDVTGTNTIERNDGGNWSDDGYQVGGQVTIRAAQTSANNGSWTITSVQDSVDGNLVVSGTLTNDTADQTLVAAVDNSNTFTTYLRVRDADPEGKTFDQSNLTSAGETAISSKIIKFPLANATDLDITATDASITGGGPWDQIVVRYFDQAFNREVDGATNRDFGIVVDVGTHSGVDGSAPGAASVLTTAEGGMGVNAYQNGTLRIHEGTDENTTFPITSNTATTITVTGTIASATDVSFTAQRQTPVVADKNEIYEKVQYLLRQASDMDATDQTVVGKTADELASFVGPTLKMGTALPTNPNGGGSGVIIEGFDANDTNDLVFTDNAGDEYTYPFVSAGTLVFNQGLVDDTDGEYWLFFEYTNRTTNSDIDVVGPSGTTYDLEGTLGTYLVGDHLWIQGFAQDANNGLFRVTVVNASGSDYTVTRVDQQPVGTAETNQTVSVDENPYPSPDAIIVQDNSTADIKGAIGSTSIGFDFDYDNNSQGGRSIGAAAVVLVAGGAELAQMARTAAGALSITRTTGLTFSLTAAQERNYDNP